MITNNPATLAQIIGFGIFLWVGLYVLVRGARRTPLIVVSLIGLFAQAIFFGTGALTDTQTDVRWFIALERWSLWTIVVPAATWFHLSSLVAQGARAEAQYAPGPIFPPLVVATYTAGALLILFGTTSDLIVDYAHPLGGPGTFAVGPGPGYPFIMTFLALTATGALINLVRARRAIARGHGTSDHAIARQLTVLAGGALFFLAGALWLTTRKNWSLPISILPGFLCLFIGLAALGYGVAHFGLLLDGQNVQRDFMYNLTGITLLNLLYGGLLALTGPATAVSALALVTLVTCTHTTFDMGRNVLDRLFFSRPERDARAEARDYASALGTTPVTTPTPELEQAADPIEEQPPPAQEAGSPNPEHEYKAFPAQVRKALTGLKSPPQLAKSPLLSLALVERRVARAGQDRRTGSARPGASTMCCTTRTCASSRARARWPRPAAWARSAAAPASASRASWSRCWPGSPMWTRTPSTNGSAARRTQSRRSCGRRIIRSRKVRALERAGAGAFPSTDSGHGLNG